MNAAHIHLITTHLVVWGTFFAFLIYLWATFSRNLDIRRVALSLFVFTGILAIVVYLSGGQAEEIVEQLPQISEEAIEPHEEAGLIALVAALATGILSAIALLPRFFGKKAMTGIVLLAGLVTVGVFLWTATLGGRIHHPEIRQVVPAEESGPAGEEAEGD